MTPDRPLALLKQRRFGPFFWTQFSGAFNDNLFKNALILLIAYQGAQLAGGLDNNILINLAAGLFVLPFFLFSATAGQLADKFEKSRLIRAIKVLEIIIMLIAAVALVLGNVWLLLTVLFLLGTQSAFFGPVKYGLLPQHLHDQELVAGNGLVEMGTFVAILIGTIAGGLLIATGNAGPYWVASAVILVAIAGYLISRLIPWTPAVDPTLKINWNVFTETTKIIGFMRQNRTVFLSIIGISWFWFFGALYLTQFPNYTHLILGGNELVGTMLLATFSLGIGLGSMLCDRMAGQKVEIGLVPFGSIGLSIFAIDLYFAVPHAAMATEHLVGPVAFMAEPWAWRVMADIFLLSLFGGFYIVPLYALIQQRATRSVLSRIIAGNNILNALAMVIAALTGALFLGVAGLSIAETFLVVAVMNAVVALYIYNQVPEFLMRFLVWMLVHTLYRARAVNRNLLPDEGPAVLVCNHVSFVDALIIAAACPRPVRFVMHHRIFKIPVLSFIFRTAKAIPVASRKEDAAMLDQAMNRVAEELAAGQIVCIFPEGALTPDGEMQAFKPGIERIIERSPVPVYPMALKGLWRSMFSRSEGRAFFKLPRGFHRRIELVIGSPVPPEAVSAPDLQQQVAALRGDIA
jgi:1-acyl-sn-glycerol-3-phosphate acyltransferase